MKSTGIVRRIDELGRVVLPIELRRTLDIDIKDSLELIDLVEEDELNIINDEIETYNKQLSNIELKLKLNDKYDKNNCIIEIHPGAGGTESCDWADMLYRMYLRFCEKHKFKVELLDYEKGEEAGIKSVTFKVIGKLCYGYLKGESGVHRLVRISPFDSNKRRHTSFAAILVTPEIEEDIINFKGKNVCKKCMKEMQQ